MRYKKIPVRYSILPLLLLLLHPACDSDTIRKVAGIPEKVNKTVNAIDSTTTQIGRVLSEYTEAYGEAQRKKMQHEMDSVFAIFRQAMLQDNKKLLTDISRLPLEGDCGFDLTAQQRIGAWLHAADMKVLEQMTASGIEKDSCLYKGRFSLRSSNSFLWSVGCTQSTASDGGEYAVTFWFSRFDGRLLLQKITCSD